MPHNTGQRRNFRRRRRGRAPTHLHPKQQGPAPQCPICQKPIRDLYSAIHYEPAGAPAHFDCVLETLRSSHELSEKDKICYLGGGSFGIIQYRTAGGAAPFLIKKRIQYEGKDRTPEWRRPLPVEMSDSERA